MILIFSYKWSVIFKLQVGYLTKYLVGHIDGSYDIPLENLQIHDIIRYENLYNIFDAGFNHSSLFDSESKTNKY